MLGLTEVITRLEQVCQSLKQTQGGMGNLASFTQIAVISALCLVAVGVWIPHVKKQAVVWRTYISCNDTISVFLALEIIH